MNNNLRFTILILIIAVKAFGQTGEFNYFYHSYLFDSTIISENNVKRITVIQYMRSNAKDKLFKQNVNHYQFDTESQLMCSESHYFSKTDSINPIQQTIDCFEYSDRNIMIRHTRFHDNRDSAEWIQNFSYDFNDNGLISKIIVTDISVPNNSNITMKYYDSDNRLIKEVTDYDYLSDYEYDEKGNLIVETSGPIDRQNIQRNYYDDRGNRIKTVFQGTSDIKEYSRLYDESNRRIRQEVIYRDGERSYSRYLYSDDLIKTEFLDQDDNLISEENMIYEGSLIKSILRKSENTILYKELFFYEFY